MRPAHTSRVILQIAELERFRGGWLPYGRLPLACLESYEQRVRESASILFDDGADYPALMEFIVEEQVQLAPVEASLRICFEKLYGGAEASLRTEGGALLGAALCSAEEVPAQLKELLAWTKANLESGEEHPLLIISLFASSFIQVAPFAKGNWALCCAFSRLLLLKSGFHFVRFLRLEERFSSQKELLVDRAKGLQEEEGGNELWAEFFLAALLDESAVLEKELLFQKHLYSFSEMEERILSFAMERPRVSIGDLEEVTQASRNTLKPRLRHLVKEGHLEQHGKGKATWYTNALLQA